MRLRKRGQYTVMTAVFLIIVVLASVSFIMRMNNELMQVKSESGQHMADQAQMQQVPSRMFSCFGRPIVTSEVTSDINCLNLKEEQGASLTILPQESCEREPITEFNFRGYGNTMQFMVPVRKNETTTCMARLGVYEHAVRVPVVTDSALNQSIVKEGSTAELNLTVYTNDSETTVENRIHNSTDESVSAEKHTITPPDNTTTFTIPNASSSPAPGLYHIALSSTHDGRYHDEWKDAYMWRIVDPNNKARFVSAEVTPPEGAFYDDYTIEATVADVINVTNVTAHVENETGGMVTAASGIQLEQEQVHPQGDLSFTFDFEKDASLALPDRNCTYNVSFVATNEYDNTITFEDVAQFEVEHTGDPVVGIFGVKSYLEDQYVQNPGGYTELDMLEEKIDEYLEALAEDGLPAEFWYVDSDELGAFGVTPAPDFPNPTEIAHVINQTRANRTMEYIILLGGSQSLPMAEVFTPLGYFKSDNVYADSDGDERPDHPYGRIPDTTWGDIDLLINQLNDYILIHKTGGGVDFGQYHADGLWKFKNTGRATPDLVCVMDAIQGKKTNTHYKDNMPCNVSHAKNKGLYIWLTHGDAGPPQKFECGHPDECPCMGGNPPLTDPVTPADVDNYGSAAVWNRAVWFMMPCLATKIDNKALVSDSTALTFLNEGGAVYIGATHNNPASVNGVRNNVSDIDCGANPPDMAGGLVMRIVEEIDVGDTIGQAYVDGKSAYDTSTSGRAVKVERINVFYGDPTLNITGKW